MSTSSLKIKLLLATALADGHFDTTELELLTNRAMWWGITPDEFEEIIDNPEITDEESEALPQEAVEKAELMSELILMAFADGRLEPPEIEILIRLGSLLDVDEEKVREICTIEAKTFGVESFLPPDVDPPDGNPPDENLPD